MEGKMSVGTRWIKLGPAALVVTLLLPMWAWSSDLKILIEREIPQGKLVPGQISVNGEIIGRTFENADKLILPSIYKGKIRYVSQKSFVQGPMGELGQRGDFLLEVSDVKGRTDILFHAGNKPYQSSGCILLGPVGRDPTTLTPTLPRDHPLRQLRTLFYGTDDPTATPDRDIVITITMASLPLHLLTTVAAVKSLTSDVSDSFGMHGDVKSQIDSLQQKLDVARQEMSVAALPSVPKRIIPALSDPSPVTQMSSMLAARLDDPTPRAMAVLATHILSSTAPNLLADGIDGVNLSKFANLSAPSSFSPEEAQSYLDSCRQYLNGSAFSEITRQLASRSADVQSTTQAEIVRMIQLHAKTTVDSVGEASALDSLKQATRGVAPNAVSGSVDSLVKLDDAIHSLVQSKADQITTVKRISDNVAAGISSLVEETVAASSQFNAHDVPSSTAEIGSRVDKLAAFVNQTSISSQVVTLIGKGALPTQDLVALVNDPIIKADTTLRDVRAKLKVVADLQNASVKDVKEMLTSNDKIVTDLAIQVAAQVGIDPNAFKSADQIVQIGMAIAGGNYLAVAQAIPGVGSFLSSVGFGGGGGDSAVMSQLAAMDKKLDQLLAGQEEIKAELKELDKKVDKLTDIVIRNHEEVMQQLTRIEQDVLLNRAVEIENLKKEFYSCYSVFDFQRPNALSQAGISKVYDYPTKELYFAAHVEDFHRCQSALKSFLAPSSISPVFTYQTNPAAAGQSPSQTDISQQAYLDDIVEPTFVYFRDKYAQPNLDPLVSNALLQVNLTSNDIYHKYSVLQKPHRANNLTSDLISDSLTDKHLFINASALSEVADFVPAVLGLWSFVDFRTNLLLGRDQLLATPTVFTKTRLAVVRELTEPPLRRLLQLLDTALAQQSLLSGDILLPELARDVATKNQANQKTVEAILKSNLLLRHNLTLYLIADHLRTTGTPTETYGTILGGNELQHMQTILADEKKNLKALELRRSDMLIENKPADQKYSQCGGKPVEKQGHWYIELTSTICEPLPSQEELYDDSEKNHSALKYTSGWTDLYIRREHVVEALAMYDFPAKLEPAQLLSLWSLAYESGAASGGNR
jgi:hypothetical protein